VSIDGLTTVEGVADFLDAEVVAAVPAELRSEVRAAVKLLRASAVELSVRHGEIGAEIDDLLVLCGAHTTAPDAARLEELTARAADHRLSLRDQERLRLDVHELVMRTMTRLAAGDDPALAEFLRCLRGHAARRSGWQAVFPVDPAPGVTA
jgi:hypothetical protein